MQTEIVAAGHPVGDLGLRVRNPVSADSIYFIRAREWCTFEPDLWDLTPDIAELGISRTGIPSGAGLHAVAVVVVATLADSARLAIWPDPEQPLEALSSASQADQDIALRHMPFYMSFLGEVASGKRGFDRASRALAASFLERLQEAERRHAASVTERTATFIDLVEAADLLLRSNRVPVRLRPDVSQTEYPGFAVLGEDDFFDSPAYPVVLVDDKWHFEVPDYYDEDPLDEVDAPTGATLPTWSPYRVSGPEFPDGVPVASSSGAEALAALITLEYLSALENMSQFGYGDDEELDDFSPTWDRHVEPACTFLLALHKGTNVAAKMISRGIRHHVEFIGSFKGASAS